MSKEDIVKQLSKECSSKGIDVTKASLGKLHDIFMETIKNDLTRKGEIRLHGIGTFSSPISKERQCRNPQNGEIMTVPEKKRVKFKASQALSSILNTKEKV
ncbi:HU family DNA-binding protein [Wolbachia pipientis]|uniref:HU family DNA-binding protein n=1 Tax=Wolbachia pipientis TaxID=955 RepID=UPI001BDA5E39|nr:HU family DNA-binding protein [Wolbachia pipientis]UIP91275.1 HU family DNA-binding protein [Wolbachia pipientis]